MPGKTDKILELDTRRRIYEIIAAFPGLHFRELLRRIDMPHSSVAYHLNYLVRNNLITEIDDGGLRRYYVRGKVDRREKEILSVLRKEIPRGLVLYLLMNPHSAYQDLLASFDLKPSQLSYYLDRLIKKGILTQSREGRNTYYDVKDEERVANVLITYRPTFLDAVVDAFVEMWTSRRR